MNLVGNLGAGRRTLIHDVFGGQEEMILNYNPHPSPRPGIGQIVCPKMHEAKVIEALRKQ